MSVSGKRKSRLSAGILILATALTPLFCCSTAFAGGQITARTLTISSSSPAASNATTTYTFTFTVPTTGTPVKSVAIVICTTASGTCSTPTGFSNSAATLPSQPTGLGAASGWTVDDTVAGTLRLSDTSNSTNPSGSQTIVFGAVQNPTTANQTFYGRITTYSDASWTTSVDSGTVAGSTATPIQLTGTMPESLIFCTGGTINTTNSIPDCSTASSGAITFNQLFSPTSTAYATSQMAASTNATSGYVITVSGPTLTSGGNTIPAIGATSATSQIGKGQFGMNLMTNTTPAIGTAVTPAANGTNFRGQPSANFNTANSFAYDASSANSIAASNNSSAGPTDAQIFTSSYIVNVSGSQTAGTYTTTLTYICTATF